MSDREETLHWPISPSNFEIFLISWDIYLVQCHNLYIKIIILDMKLRSTCGESNLYWNTVNWQNIIAEKFSFANYKWFQFLNIALF